MVKALRLLIIPLMVCIIACDDANDYIIPKNKMKDVMYDYCLAQGLGQTLPPEKKDLAVKYKEAAFEKHGVTEAQFDSSLVYYFRHIEDMQDIINDLNTRFDDYDKMLQLQGGSNEMRANVTLSGDTTDIWTGKKLIILRNSRFLNKETFTVKADTTFHLNDRFNLVADYDFIREDPTDRNNNLTACIAIHYRDGKTVSSVNQSNVKGRFDCQINAIDDKEIESISGYFLFMGDKGSTRSLGVIKDISVYRIHTTDKQQSMPADTVKTDSVKTDSAHIDTVRKAGQRHQQKRLTPEELREMNTSNRPDAKIKKAPDVRTPNSIGPRRKITKRNNRQ